MIAPSSREATREAARRRPGKSTMPATASGTAAKKPTSAREGNGTCCPRMISIRDQTVSPAAQANADAPSIDQARRMRPRWRNAATAQATAAISAAAASPKSSIASVTSTPAIRSSIQAPNTVISRAATAPAMMKSRLLSRRNGNRRFMPP